MPTRSKNGGFTLPAVIDPPRVCVRLMIPNDPDHLRAFWGTLWELTFWNNWQRDPDHKGAALAAVWKDVLFQAQALNLTLEACGEFMDVRQSPIDPCILEKSADGVIWSAFADLSLCMPRITRNPATGHYRWSVDDITFYEFPDGAWVDPAPGQTFATPRPREEATTDERLCQAAANAAAIIRETYRQVGDSALDDIVNNIERAATVGSILEGIFLILGLPAVVLNVGGLAGILGIILSVYRFENFLLDDEDEDRLICILLDNASETGETITFDWQGVWDAIDLETPKNDNVRAILGVLGGDGLNFAGSVNYLIGDCEHCEVSCSYADPLTAELGPKTFIDGIPGLTTNVGQYVVDNGRTGGGSIAPTEPDDQSRINVVIDLGTECIIESCKCWVKVDANAGAYCRVDVHYFTDTLEDAGNGGFRLFASGVGSQVYTLAEFDPQGPGAPLARYVRFTAFDLAVSEYYIDDIEINVE